MTDNATNSEYTSQPSEPLHTRFLRSGRFRNAEERTAIHALAKSEILDTELVPWGSNYTFAIALQNNDPQPFLAIYKPEEGEAPLWDFPSGTLYRREYASYLLSRFLGWRFVPPTVIRDGPYGRGTVQLYIEPEQNRMRVSGLDQYREELQQIALFDVITNNADRKASHFFLGRYQRQIWGIDHGLTFNVHPKLRTVLWDFGGEPVSPCLVERLKRLERHRGALTTLLTPYLDGNEIRMVFARAKQIRTSGVMPTLTSRRSIPFGW